MGPTLLLLALSSSTAGADEPGAADAAAQPAAPRIEVIGGGAVSLSDFDRQLVEQMCVGEAQKQGRALADAALASAVEAARAGMASRWAALDQRKAFCLGLETVTLRAPCIAQVTAFLDDASSLAVERSAGAQEVTVRLDPSPVGRAVDCGARAVEVPAARLAVEVPEVHAARALLAALQAEGPADVAGATVRHEVVGVTFEAVVVPAGAFLMGSPEDEPGRDDDELQVRVTLSRPLEVMRAEVTQGLYRAITGESPAHFASCGDACPVESVSWYQAVQFANHLSAAQGLVPAYGTHEGRVIWHRDANGWRLPTEAEWEYAARAGARTRYAGASTPDEVAWHGGNSGGTTHPVCLKATNAWGLCDMSGNVFEWTWDWDQSPRVGGTDPAGPRDGERRVGRGGSWMSEPQQVRVAYRAYDVPGGSGKMLGFRLVRTPVW